MTSGINLVAGVLVGFSAPAALLTPAWGWGIASGICLALIGAAIDYHAAGGIIAGDPVLRLVNGYDAHTGHIVMGALGAVLVVAVALWIRKREEQAFQRYFS